MKLGQYMRMQHVQESFDLPWQTSNKNSETWEKKIKPRNSFNENVHQPKRRIAYEILVLVIQMLLCVSVYC